jgi:hypothetical protein
VPPECLDLGLKSYTLQGIPHFLGDPFHRFRFVDETVGSKPDCLRAAVVISGPRVDDDRDPDPPVLKSSASAPPVETIVS